ncbi:MAG: hypothetical protein NVS2B7_00760 [Herpetosiphon sp.]
MEGIHAGRSAHAISVAIDNAWGQVHSAVHLTPGLLDVGAVGEALAIAHHGVTVARANGIHMLPVCLARLGSVYRTMFALDAAREAHLEALALDGHMPGHPFRALIAGELCADYALAQSWNTAHQYALRAGAASNRSLLYLGFLAWFEVEALLRGGDQVAAEVRVQRLGERAQHNPRYRLPYLRGQAVLAQWLGNGDQALSRLEAARAAATELGLLGEEWPINVALAELYAACGASAERRRPWNGRSPSYSWRRRPLTTRFCRRAGSQQRLSGDCSRTTALLATPAPRESSRRTVGAKSHSPVAIERTIEVG